MSLSFSPPSLFPTSFLQPSFFRLLHKLFLRTSGERPVALYVNLSWLQLSSSVKPISKSGKWTLVFHEISISKDLISAINFKKTTFRHAHWCTVGIFLLDR
mmetsp:Transcript_21002/g.29431  ORF Transcript_21002/g.29431 Transcript_21002/m.29431 type:complete len:101 (-) Transcript_21002:250-552(-)